MTMTQSYVMIIKLDNSSSIAQGSNRFGGSSAGEARRFTDIAVTVFSIIQTSVQDLFDIALRCYKTTSVFEMDRSSWHCPPHQDKYAITLLVLRPEKRLLANRDKKAT